VSDSRRHDPALGPRTDSGRALPRCDASPARRGLSGQLRPVEASARGSQGWSVVMPRQCLLELGGDLQEPILTSRRRDELHADG
jgi:hypothetical protein